MSYRKGALSLFAAASALVLATAAHAADQGPTTVGEIVVTAQKRAEPLKDVPVSVSVVDTAQLNQLNVSSLNDLARAVPSLNVTGGTLGIRGVSTNGFARSSESSVSVVLDGVVLGRAQIDTLFDIARVEVLSGPQGMLFGKNASAGVINLVTNAPDPSRYEAIFHVDVGNFEYQRDRLTVNLPITSTSALRISAHYDHSGGYESDVFTGQTQETYDYGARARFLWKPTDNLSVNLIGDYEKQGGTGLFAQAYAMAPAGSALAQQLAACGVTASVSNTKVCSEAVSSLDARQVPWGLSAQIDYVLPNDYTITSITANRWESTGPQFYYAGPGSDADLLNTNIFSTDHIPLHTKTFSQELRLTSPSHQRVAFVAGLYFSGTRSTDEILQAGTLGLPSFLFAPPLTQVGRIDFVDVYQRSYAAFGQATIHATDQLSFTLGGRYTDDFLKDNTNVITDSTTPSLADFGFLEVPSFNLAAVHQRVTTHNFSWRAGAQYDWTPNIMTYFTAARGYKGPAVNDQASPPLVQAIIQPEIPMYFEAGLKGEFFDHRLFATIALFHNKVKDFQTAVFTPPTPDNPVPGFAQGNAPDMVSKGVEIDLSGRPVEGLTLNGGLLYNAAKYSSDFLVACNTMQTPGVGNCSALGTTSPVDQVAGVPKWRATFNGEYARQVANNLMGFVQSDFTFQTGVHLSPTPDPIPDIYSNVNQWLLGARIGVRTADDRYSFSLWGRNLLNNHYYQLTSDPLAAFEGGGTSTYRVATSPDLYRTWGVTLEGKF